MIRIMDGEMESGIEYTAVGKTEKHSRCHLSTPSIGTGRLIGCWVS
jgi:hypothetical protein